MYVVGKCQGAFKLSVLERTGVEEEFETGVCTLQLMPCAMRKLQRQKNPARVAGPVVVSIVVCSA